MAFQAIRFGPLHNGNGNYYFILQTTGTCTTLLSHQAAPATPAALTLDTIGNQLLSCVAGSTDAVDGARRP